MKGKHVSSEISMCFLPCLNCKEFLVILATFLPLINWCFNDARLQLLAAFLNVLLLFETHHDLYLLTAILIF